MRLAAELAVDLLSFLCSLSDRLFKILNSENASTLDPDNALCVCQNLLGPGKRLSVTFFLLELSCFVAYPGSTVTCILLWNYRASPCDRGDVKHLKLQRKRTHTFHILQNIFDKRLLSITF